MRRSNHSEHKTTFTNLSSTKQLAFGILLFERMLPLLLSFSRKTGFDVSVYLEGRTSVWKALQVDSKTRKQIIESQSNACIENAPHTESYSGELVSHALNAALAMANLLRFVIDENPGHIVEIGTWVTDSIDTHIQSIDLSPTSELTTRQLDSNPLMKEEYGRQRADINFLVELPETFDRRTIERLKERASAQLPILAGGP